MCRRLYVSVGPLAASLILSIALSMALPATAQAQRSLEISLGAGYTAVDVEAAARTAGDVANDWNQLLYGGTARLYFAELPTARLGVEVGWYRVYWYEVRVPTSPKISEWRS